MDFTTCTDTVDIKIHFNYNGQNRCALVDCSYAELYSMNFDEFTMYLHNEVGQLSRIGDVKRYTFLDDENTYVIAYI